MVHITSIDLVDIEAFIIYQNDQSIFAIQLHNQPNLLVQSSYRSTILVQLISLFEKNNYDKFKIYHTNHISVKQFLDASRIELGSYEQRLAEDELESKKLELRALLQVKLKERMANTKAA